MATLALTDATLADLVDGAGDAPAVEDPGGAWTRAELAAAAGGVARSLRETGVRPGDRVAVVLPNGRPLVAGLLGARACGAVACPVDPRLAGELLPTLRPRAVVDALPSPATLAVDPGPPVGWGIGTSGSTGRSRFVALTEASVAFVTGTMQALVPYRAGERVLCALPLHHTYGLSQLWLSLRAGATLVLAPTPALPGDLARLAAHADVLPAVPALVRGAISGEPLPNLRLVTLAGQETLPGDRARFAAALPDTAFVVFYGQTEATTRILWLPPEDFLRHADAAGRPIPGVEARLEDDELVVTGPNVAAGWLDGPRFDGVLRTGDLFAPHPAGYRFLGRRDGVFKRAGEKVVPERIEAALRAHPAVESCLVSPERGARGDLEPVARVVTRQTVDAAALLRFCRATLPPAMVPARILLVPALAATLSGKVSRWPPA